MRFVAPLAALVLLSSVATWAQDAYWRTRVAGKEICIFWSDRSFTYRVHDAGSVKTPGDTEFAAIDASFQSWQEVALSCSDFRITKGPGIAQVTVGYDAGTTDNHNIVTFREVNCNDVVAEDHICWDTANACANQFNCWDNGDSTIALTLTTFSRNTGVIYDADIELNAAPQFDGASFLFTTVDSPPCDPGNESTTCVAYDIENTMTHEIGHALGLDHVDLVGSTMEPSADVGETKKRTIDDGSRAGFCDTYPAGLPATPCDDRTEASQRIVAVNKGTGPFFACSSTGASGAVAFLGMLWLTLAALRTRATRTHARPRQR